MNAIHPYFSIQHGQQTGVAVTGRYADAARDQEFNLSHNQADKSTLDANLSKLTQDFKLTGLAMLKQVHGADLLEVTADNQANLPEADGLFTTQKGLGLVIRQADCQAVVLSAPGLVANLHVGWRGNVLNLPGKALRELSLRFNIAPERFSASIHPSLGPCCAEFINYREELPEPFWPFMVSANHFNLWAVSAWQLLAQGLKRANLKVSAVCTKCCQDLYSYRRGQAGRFATLVFLRD